MLEVELSEFSLSSRFRVVFFYMIETQFIRFTYQVSGSIDELNLSILKEADKFQRRDELWLDTCFEFFIQESGSSYEEFNLSSSGDWQNYHFLNYRDTRSLSDGCVSELVTSFKPRSYEISGVFNVPFIITREKLRFNPVVVLKTSEQTLYYAKDHPQSKPDFHDQACWPLLEIS